MKLRKISTKEITQTQENTQKNEIHSRNSSNIQMRKWIKGVENMNKNATKHDLGDIREVLTRRK